VPQWIEIALRTLLAAVVLFVITKILGKRQITQLSYFEYITGITVGGIAAIMSLDLRITWYYGPVALIVWATVALGLEYISLKSKVARNIINGQGVVLIKEGKVLEDNLRKVRFTSDDLLEELRGKNAFSFSDVEFAVLEADGKLNVLLNKATQPLTSKNLGIKVAPEQEPQTVIMDGKILDEPLATIGLNRHWLDTELKKIGVSIENVFIGQVDSYGQLTVDLFDDQIKVPKPQSKAKLLATLKKCEADIEMFALGSKDKKAKEMYQQCSKELQEVIASVKPILSR